MCVSVCAGVRGGQIQFRSPDNLAQVRVRDGPSCFFFSLVLRSGFGWLWVGFGFGFGCAKYSVPRTPVLDLNYVTTYKQAHSLQRLLGKSPRPIDRYCR